MQYLLSECEYKSLLTKSEKFEKAQKYIQNSSTSYVAKAYNSNGAVVMEFQDGYELKVNLMNLLKLLDVDCGDKLHITLEY